MAHSYARAVCALPDAVLVGVADDDESRGREAAGQYGAAYFSDSEKLLESGLDAVVVCSENARHREHVIALGASRRSRSVRKTHRYHR